MHTKALSLEKIAKKKKISVGNLNIRAVFTKSGEGAPIYQQDRSRSNTMTVDTLTLKLDGGQSTASTVVVKPSKTEVKQKIHDHFKADPENPSVIVTPTQPTIASKLKTTGPTMINKKKRIEDTYELGKTIGS